VSEKPEAQRLTVEDLEKMTTHDLADLLANVVLVLKQLPNVSMNELVRETSDGVREGGLVRGVRGRATGAQRMPDEYGW